MSWKLCDFGDLPYLHSPCYCNVVAQILHNIDQIEVRILSTKRANAIKLFWKHWSCRKNAFHWKYLFVQIGEPWTRKIQNIVAYANIQDAITKFEFVKPMHKKSRWWKMGEYVIGLLYLSVMLRDLFWF